MLTRCDFRTTVIVSETESKRAAWSLEKSFTVYMRQRERLAKKGGIPNTLASAEKWEDE